MEKWQRLLGTMGVMALALFLAQGSWAKDLVPIKVAVCVRSSVFSPVYVAIDKGFYKDAGLEVALTVFSGGPHYYSAVVAKAIDAGTCSFPDLIAQYAKKGPVRAVANSDYGSPTSGAWVTRPDTGITGEVDPKTGLVSKLTGAVGKKFGVSAPGSLTWLSTTRKLKELGLLDKTEIVAAGFGPPMMAALEGKIIDVGIIPGELFHLAMEKGYKHLGQYDVDYPIEVYSVHKDLIEKRPEAVKGFVEASLKGAKYLREHTDEILPLIAKQTGLTRLDILKKTLAEYRFSLDGAYDYKGIDYFVDSLVELKLIPRRLTPQERDDLFLTRFLPKKG